MQELYAMLNQDALRVAQGMGWEDGPRFKVPQEVLLAHCYSERSVKNL
ncbi:MULTISPECIES: hypothetical protein [unclassified Sphingobacterium]|nr:MULTISPECIES: hypothetical protein [unclassified Sphingobacterium]